MTRDKKTIVKDALKSVLPIVLGYIPVAMAFGVLARNIEISLFHTSLFSIMVYAGASQFMALDLLQSGIGGMSIILTTFLLNLRHMVMSASISTKFTNIKRSSFPIVAFGLTDETFSILYFTKNNLSLTFVLTVNLMAYLSWVLATIVGYLLGEALPASLQASLGIGLYGMFAALLIPQLKGKRNNLLVSFLAVIIYLLIDYMKIFTTGWDIVLGIVLSSLMGVFLFRGEGEEVND